MHSVKANLSGNRKIRTISTLLEVFLQFSSDTLIKLLQRLLSMKPDDHCTWTGTHGYR